MKNICDKPFNFLETHCVGNGDVFVCCPSYINDYAIGNIHKNNTFEEIWNGEKSQEFRKTILDGSYKYCNLDLCYFKNDKFIDFEAAPVMKKYPKIVKFSHELQCNVRCLMCRDKHIYSTKEETEKLNNLIEPIFIPMLKDAEIVWLNGSGEFFASKHMRTLAKRIAQVYPNLKFGIHSNGLCFDKKNCDEIGITDRIEYVQISLHAATKRTYDKVVKDSDFDKIKKNIEWLSELYKQGQIKSFDLLFVISSLNYKDMIAFQKYANKLRCRTIFSTFRDWGTEMGKNYKNYAVFEPNHPEYNNLTKILKHPIFKSPNCTLQNSLQAIMEAPIERKWSNLFTFFK